MEADGRDEFPGRDEGSEGQEDRYRVVREIGRGEMSVVYEAFDPRLERRVAFKLLTLSASLTDEQREARLARFKREAEAVARLRHPNVIDVYDFGRRPDGIPFLVMEYVDGPTLAALLAEQGPFSPVRAAAVLDQIADGLDAVHAQGVIHRDLKPGNIMMLGDVAGVANARSLPRGAVKLLDFGLARHGDDVTLTRTGILVGSPAYLSPERVRGEPATEAADLWALAVILYELLAGRRPFAGEDTVSVLYQIAHTDAPRIQGLGPHVEAVLARALSRDPRGRYPTGREFSQAFRAALGGAASVPAAGPAPFRPADPGATVEVDAEVGAEVDAASVGGGWRSPLPATHRPQARRRTAAVLALVGIPAALVLGGFGLSAMSAMSARGRETNAPVAAMLPEPAAPPPKVAAAATQSPEPTARPTPAAKRAASVPTPASPRPSPAAVAAAPAPTASAKPQPTPTPRTVIVYVPTAPAAPAPKATAKSSPAAPKPEPSPIQVARATPPPPRPTPATTPAPAPAREEKAPEPSPTPSRLPPSLPRFRQVAQNGGRPLGGGRPTAAPPSERPAPAPTTRGERPTNETEGRDPAPAGNSLVGIWKGNIYKNKAVMHITGRDGDSFRGVLTVWTENGVARASVSGQVTPDGGRVSFRSAGFLPGSAVTDIDLGESTGGIISPRLMGGKTVNSQGTVVFWTLRR